MPALLIPIAGYSIYQDSGEFWRFEYKNYRQSPQFKSYMKQTGVFAYWQQAGFPPRYRPLGENDFECD